MNINAEQYIERFIDRIRQSICENTFVKITISSPVNKSGDLKNVYAKRVIIKNEEKISFTYRHIKRDIVKNYSTTEACDLIAEMLKNDFNTATLFTICADILYSSNNAKTSIKEHKATITELPSLSHDRNKERKIQNEAGKKYQQLLELTDERGNILAKSQNKYKQITHYIEILSAHLQELPSDETLCIADMGSGKGYLTFALYDYLTNTLKRKANVTGVEVRPDMVKLCNQIAKESDFSGLNFIEGRIDTFETEKLDILIALHACNTATDDALIKGVNHNAKLIVVAPCCQHQIREEMENGKPDEILAPILRHGIFMERQAELITDAIRILYLQYNGYKTKAIEFISDAHTHKNIIIAQKASIKDEEKAEIIEKLNNLKKLFGIDKHYIESQWKK